jgi:hypothetical protein
MQLQDVHSRPLGFDQQKLEDIQKKPPSHRGTSPSLQRNAWSQRRSATDSNLDRNLDDRCSKQLDDHGNKEVEGAATKIQMALQDGKALSSSKSAKSGRGCTLAQQLSTPQSHWSLVTSCTAAGAPGSRSTKLDTQQKDENVEGNTSDIPVEEKTQQEPSPTTLLHVFERTPSAADLSAAPEVLRSGTPDEIASECKTSRLCPSVRTSSVASSPEAQLARRGPSSDAGSSVCHTARTHESSRVSASLRSPDARMADDDFLRSSFAMLGTSRGKEQKAQRPCVSAPISTASSPDAARQWASHSDPGVFSRTPLALPASSRASAILRSADNTPTKHATAIAETPDEVARFLATCARPLRSNNGSDNHRIASKMSLAETFLNDRSTASPQESVQRSKSKEVQVIDEMPVAARPASDDGKARTSANNMVVPSVASTPEALPRRGAAGSHICTPSKESRVLNTLRNAETTPSRFCCTTQDTSIDQELASAADIAAEAGLRRLAASSFEAIAIAMRVRMSNARAQKEGLAAMLDICGDRQDVAHRAVPFDAVNAVIIAMKAHCGDADIQEWACLTLDRLISHDASCRTTAGAQGGIEAVASAMKAHRGNVGVQARACAALANLSADGHVGNQARAAAASVPECILLALQAHPCNKIIRHSGEKTLKQLEPIDEATVAIRGGA